jgi:hypothetical protein
MILVLSTVLVYFPANTAATPASVRGYSQYTGNTISLQYPTDWTINNESGLENSEGDVIKLSNNMIPAEILVLSGPQLYANNISLVTMTQDEIESRLEQIFPEIALKPYISASEPCTLIELEKPVYERYMVVGQRAGTAVWTTDCTGIPTKNIMVGNIVGTNGLSLIYRAPEEVFDQNLPIAENIIKSIKFLQPTIGNMAIRNGTDGNMTSAGGNMPNATTATTEGTMNTIGGNASVTGPAMSKNLNGIWERDDGQRVIITQQGLNVIAGVPNSRATCVKYGLIDKGNPIEFEFRGIVQNGKIIAENAGCYTGSLNQSENGLLLSKAEYTVNKNGTGLEGFVINRYSGDHSPVSFHKVADIQPINLNLKTDREKYESTQIVHLTGILSEILPSTNQTVSLQIFDPNGQPYDSLDVIVKPDKSYSYDLNIRNDTGKGVFKVIATYAGFGDTANFEYGVAQPSIPVFFQAPVLNNANVTTIEGSPAAISLFYNDGELPSANNVAYKVKFEIPNEKFRILKFDKGTFDSVDQVSNDTLIFNTTKILKNENKTGLVIFAFDNNLTRNPKLTLYSDVMVNRTTQKTVIDPAIGGILSIGTSIVKLAKDSFELGSNFYHEFVPCVNLREKDLPEFNTNLKRTIEIINCSNHPQKTILSTTGLPAFIRTLFNPSEFDIDSNRTTDSILTLQVGKNTLSDKQNFDFNVSGDVIYNVFGHYVKVASSTTQSNIAVEPEQPVKINCSNLGKSADSPELIQVINPINTDANESQNITSFDNLGPYGKYLMQVCIMGYDKISKTRSPMDVIFSIDSSRSMEENDKDNLRIAAAKSFIDRLNPNIDKIGIITWAGEVVSRVGLTSDFPFLKNELDKIELARGTNLDMGLSGAVELLDENKSTQDNRTKVIVFLSDGLGDYTNSADPESVTKSAAVRGYKIYSVGLNVNYDSEAANDLRDIASATNGVYYSSPIAENLNDIYSKIFQNIVTKGSPKQIDLLVTLPKEELKVNDFSIEPSNIDLENKKVIWKNISQHIGNKDNALSSDENLMVSFIIEKLLSNNNEVNTLLNYTDTDGKNESIPKESFIPSS